MVAVDVHTPAGIVIFHADQLRECIWCKREKVLMCRKKPGDQWVPVSPITNKDGSYELHRCEQAVAYNNTLRHHMQLPRLKMPWEEDEWDDMIIN